jgi:hypothetical protein
MTVSEMKKREKEVIERAKKVYDISFDYHLTHAVFGGDKLLLIDLKGSNEAEVANLRDDLRVATRGKNEAQIKDLMDKIDKLKKNLKYRKYHIMIDYIKMDDPDGGRAVKANNKLIISLPQKLTKDIMNDDGRLQKNIVEKIRGKMAHELGHIVLHTEQLPNDLESGNKLDDLDWEAEIFAKELLRLYSEKDHRIK